MNTHGTRASPLRSGLAVVVIGAVAGVVALSCLGCGGRQGGVVAGLHSVYDAPTGVEVEHVLPIRGNAKARTYVFAEGEPVGLFDDTGKLTLGAADFGPLPGRLTARQRIAASESGSAVGVVTYLDPMGTGPAMSFELIRNRVVAWRADLGHRATMYLAESSDTVVAVYQDIHVSGPAKVTFFDDVGTARGPIDVPRIRSVAISADGARVAFGTETDGVRVFDGKGQALHSLSSTGDVRLSADGRTLVVLEAGQAVVYAGATQVGAVPTQGTARAAAIASTGSVAVIDDKALHYFDGVARLTKPRLVEVTPPERLQTVALDHGEDRILLGSIRIQARPSRTQPGSATAAVRELTLGGKTVRSPATFQTASWSILSPALRPLARGRLATVHALDQVYLFRGGP